MASNARRQSKPFYLRWWFLLPSVLCLLGVGGAVAVWFVFLEPYRIKAETYDLKKVGELESASIIYDRNKRVLGQIYVQNRYVIPYEDIPKSLRDAVMASEDARFYEHHGVDYYGIARAMTRNLGAGKVEQGASTITQQLGRNTFELFERSYKRKLLEMFIALRIEKQYTKTEILTHYLNRIYFGSGFYGAEAAAKGYFGKRAKDMTIGESAILSGLIRSPENLQPFAHPERCLAERNRVLQRMYGYGWLTSAEYEHALSEKLVLAERVPFRSQSYILDYVRQQAIAIIASTDNGSATADGYHIYTSIDADLQKSTAEAVASGMAKAELAKGYEGQTLAQYDQLRAQALADPAKLAALPAPEYLQGAAIVLDNPTGGILALVGGRNFDHSQFNRAISARRQPGTAFTPFVYAAAFEKGIFPGRLFLDGVMDNKYVNFDGMEGILGEWGVENSSNKYEGDLPARFALVKGKNGATVRVGNEAGQDNVIKMAKACGIESEVANFSNSFLGRSENTLAEFALAYTNFPNGGTHADKPFIIERIVSYENEEIYLNKTRQVRAMREATAYQVHSCLGDVLRAGTAARAYTELGLQKFDGGGKTGTAYKFTDLWFAGYSSKVTCAVWAGYDKPRTIFNGAFSNALVLPVWVDIMNASTKNFVPTQIKVPDNLEKVEVCLRSGQLATDSCYETDTTATIEGQPRQRRTSYIEYATAPQKPTRKCPIHSGEAGPQIVEKSYAPDESGAPRATAAIDLSSIPAVHMQSKTIIGTETDPYNSYKPAIAPGADLVPAEGPGTQVAPGQPVKEVRKASPAGPLDQQPEKPLIEPPKPPPLKFES